MLTIYSKEDCPMCESAIRLCKMRNIEHTIKKLNHDFTQDDLLSMTQHKARSYPQIFQDETYVGGFVDFQKALASGAIH